MKLRNALTLVLVTGVLAGVTSLTGCSKPEPTTPGVKPGVPIGPGNLPPPPGGTKVTPPPAQ